MNKLEELINKMENENVSVFDNYNFNSKLKGLYVDNNIAISKELNSDEKFCILCEEAGHHYTSFGDILDTKNKNNHKQEMQARNYGYRIGVPLDDIVKAYYKGCRTFYEFATYMGVTEEFFINAINYYKNKYGVYYRIENDVIQFEPYLEIYNVKGE